MGYIPRKTAVTIKRRFAAANRKPVRGGTPIDKYGKSVLAGDIVVNPRIVPLPDGDYIPQLFSHTVDRVEPGNKCWFMEYPDSYGPFDTTKFVRVLRATES